MTFAILCSGQGGQHREMFALTGQAAPAQSVFDAATGVLDGRDPRDLVQNASDEELHSDLVGQVLCCTQALAAWSVLREKIQDDAILAGYSIGELATWGCAGLFDAPGLMRLARTRAQLMDATAGNATGLAAIRGLTRATLQSLCGRHNAEIAIVNGSDSFVVGGPRDVLPALCEEATRSGALRAVVLQVAIASHTPRLRAASPRFRAALAEVARPPRMPSGIRLLSGIDGTMVIDVEAGLDKLATQISHAIDWAACLEACREVGADPILELGPGAALANMAREAIPGARCRSLEEFRTFDGAVAWLKR